MTLATHSLEFTALPASGLAAFALLPVLALVVVLSVVVDVIVVRTAPARVR